MKQRLHSTLIFALFGLFALMQGCQHASLGDPLVAIQIQDRNSLTETISTPDRLKNYEELDFFSAQPYKKVLRIYRNKGKSHSKITTYHSNGSIWQYLEAEELRAHGAFREWHPNGQIKIEAQVIGGTADVAPGNQRDWLFDNTSRVWDEQGNLLALIPYKGGVLEGVSIYFHPNGQIEKELPYHNHSLEGISTQYFPNGKIQSTTSYKQGEKQGKSLGYFENGQVAWEEEYTENLILHGTYYNPKGEILSKIEDGRGFRALFEGNSLSHLIQIQQGFAEGGVKQFTDKGELQATYHIKYGKKIGEETVYFLASEKPLSSKAGMQPKLSIHWSDNTVHGTVKTWYSSGQLQSERDYCHNKKTGPSLAWYKDGSLMLVEEYEEDKLLKGQYYKKNALDATSSITNGTGIASLYDENGVFLRKVTYVKGEPVDPE